MSENPNLLAEQRRALILDEVRRRGGVRVNELTRKLGVSDMTVRRDLDALSRQGVLEKVHGGAVPVAEASTHEPGFEAKSGLEPTAKEDIARAAAELVAPGAAIALSGGTTTYALAHRLVDVPDLTVVTNSVRVADVFHVAQRTSGARQGGATVVLTGGVRTPSDSLVGPVADQAIATLHFDALFLGVHGISAGRPVHAEPRGGRDEPAARAVGTACRGGRGPHQVGCRGPEFVRRAGAGGHARHRLRPVGGCPRGGRRTPRAGRGGRAGARGRLTSASAVRGASVGPLPR